MIIDTHTHLDADHYQDDVDEVIQNALNKGIERFIVPGTNSICFERALKLSATYEQIFYAVGFHPYDLQDFNEAVFFTHQDDPKYVAVGECGLDYFRGDENMALQKERFVQHIKISKTLRKPLIVHIRDAKDSFQASEDAKALLIKHEAFGGVLHCFNAAPTLIELADHNFYYGIGGILTFKNAKALVDILPQIPQDKLLIETDSPYLAPTPHRGKRNEPQFIAFVLEHMSDLLGMTPHALQTLLHQNTKRLFPTLF